MNRTVTPSPGFGSGKPKARRWAQGVLAWIPLAVVSLAVAEPPPVPATLGQGTGGDGPWSASGAPHSPTTIRVDETAGPESTPAAVLEFEFGSGKYNYNWSAVDTGSVDPTGFVALRFTYRTEVPEGFPGLNVMVRESGGAGYWVPKGLPLSPGRFTTVTLPFAKFSLPGWSKDDNGKLDVNLIHQVCVGLETGSPGEGRVFLSDVELVPGGW